MLRDRGRRKRTGLCSAYTRSPADYQAGTKTFKFDSGVYGHKTVKQALIKAQYGKCCFCESKGRHIAHGDVEHFRPKAGYRQKPSDPLAKPGYYWLAYEWSNLLFCCQLCNQRFKGNLFPLRDSRRRAVSHRDELFPERPLLINPAEVDPVDHISFRAEVPNAVDNSPEGKNTIEVLGLARQALIEQRLERLALLEHAYIVANITPPLPQSDRAKAVLKKATQDSAEYAAMARAAISSGFARVPLPPG